MVMVIKIQTSAIDMREASIISPAHPPKVAENGFCKPKKMSVTISRVYWTTYKIHQQMSFETKPADLAGAMKCRL